MKGSIWTVAVVACALALLVPLSGTALVDSAAGFDASENTTVDYDVNYSLENDDVFSYTDNTVTAGGSELEAGTDYEFLNESGEINWINTTATTDGEDVQVQYSFEDATDRTKTQRDLLGLFGPWIGLLLVVVSLGTVLKMTFGGF